VTQSVSPTEDPQKVRLNQDPSADFHVYTVEWTPPSARFLIDDVEQRVWTTRIDRMTLPQNVLMTIVTGGTRARNSSSSAKIGWTGDCNYVVRSRSQEC
jgi:beta-glucanase (GH16 family)